MSEWLLLLIPASLPACESRWECRLPSGRIKSACNMTVPAKDEKMYIISLWRANSASIAGECRLPPATQFKYSVHHARVEWPSRHVTISAIFRQAIKLRGFQDRRGSKPASDFLPYVHIITLERRPKRMCMHVSKFPASRLQCSTSSFPHMLGNEATSAAKLFYIGFLMVLVRDPLHVAHPRGAWSITVGSPNLRSGEMRYDIKPGRELHSGAYGTSVSFWMCCMG